MLTHTLSVERITQAAAKELGIDISLLRVGQLCGSTRTGHWNASEMFPILFATSLHPLMACVPAFPSRTVDWVPVDVAAATISNVLLLRSDGAGAGAVDGTDGRGRYEVHNVVNPKRIEWRELVSMLRDTAPPGRTLEEVSMREWVAKLSQLADAGVSPDEVPGLRLLHVFEGMAGEGEGEGGQERVFETRKTALASSAMAGCEAFNRHWLGKNVDVWRESGFLK